MGDELGRTLAGAFTDGGEDARLGHASEVVLDRGPEARVHHVEFGGARQPIGLGHAAIKSCLGDSGGAVGIWTLI